MKAVENGRLLVKRSEKILDEHVEGAIAFAGFCYFADRVKDGGMVFTAEALTYLRQRRTCQRFRQIHPDLARLRD